MALAKDDGRDPAQKLKDLHTWLMNNKVSAKFPERRIMRTTWAAPANAKAAAELEDFQRWISDMQSPVRVGF